MKYYLRLEGVNLRNFIYDTQDLSTIRGGSLLLLEAVERLAERLRDPALTPITTGASSGIFSFDAPGESHARRVRDLVEESLNKHAWLRHATFVVDYVACNESRDFADHRERLIALNRWRQMRQPSLAVPVENRQPFHTENGSAPIQACEVDFVRPGTTMIAGQEKLKDWVSESVKKRREFGREQKKHDFYLQKAGFDGQFTRTLDELTDWRGLPERRSDNQSNLHHKMAVLYVDGNGFGKIQTTLARSETEQRDWDQSIKSKRRSILAELLKSMRNDVGWIWRNRNRQEPDKYRFETLIWGGDELLWLIPAWKGWETLAQFYRMTKDWEFKGQRLTHAAGLVFCHHNAPIHRITALASKLAQLAKSRDAEARQKNLFAYEVLESFDHIGTDIEQYRQERCPWAAGEGLKSKVKELILPGEAIEEAIPHFRRIKEFLPRRALYRIVQGLRRPDQSEARSIRARLLTEIPQETRTSLAKLMNCFGDTDTSWFHIVALWDYFD